jgi:hypothetical protein
MDDPYMNGVRLSVKDGRERFGLRATHLFRIRDLNAREPHCDTPAAEPDLGMPADEFSRELDRHYLRWPRIAASCVKQPGPTGAWVIRLVSALSIATVQGSLLELLAHLNRTLADGQSTGQRFELQEMTNQSSQVALHVASPQRLQ